MISEEIERLTQLRNSGALSEDEFQQAKARVLSGQPTQPQGFFGQHVAGGGQGSGLIFGFQPKVWCMLMHASQLLTWTGVGVVAPIVMWIISKEESREANRHGLVIVNWLLSSLIYAVVSGVLCIVFIGVPMVIVLGLLLIIFPIIGAIKAGNGELWRYPLTINFFDPDAV